MDGVIDMEQARALVADRTIWPLIRDFLWDFAPQVHSSWLEGLEGEGPEAAGAGREGEAISSLVPRLMSSPRVKRHVLDALGVEPCFHLFPKDDGSRILLLDGPTLSSIVQWLGALACVEQLRRVTAGAAVRELKAAFPGVYPEVFGFTAYFRGLGSAGEENGAGVEGGNASLAEKVVSVGCGILSGSLSNLPQHLVRRLVLKLPSSFADLPARNNKPETRNQKPGTFRQILKLLKLKFPEAYSICC